MEPGRFTAVLVGKDGAVKHHSFEPFESEDLYGLVDAMRRREMGERDRDRFRGARRRL